MTGTEIDTALFVSVIMGSNYKVTNSDCFLRTLGPSNDGDFVPPTPGSLPLTMIIKAIWWSHFNHSTLENLGPE